MTTEHTALVAQLEFEYGGNRTVRKFITMMREMSIENERLHNAIVTCPLVDVTAERDTLRAEVAALRKDAERLEWALRERDGWGEFVSLVGAHWACDGMPKPWIPYARDAIDERMRNESEQDAALADKPLSGPTP